MPSLTERAERALLGAMLTDPYLGSRYALTAADFASRLHKTIFFTIREALQQGPANVEERASYAIGVGRWAASAQYARILDRSCPVPLHASAYAGMVAEAALIRQLTSHAGRLYVEASRLERAVHTLDAGSQTASRTAQDSDFSFETAPGGRMALHELPGHELALAIALHEHLSGFDPGRDPGRAAAEPASKPSAERRVSAGSSTATAIWQSADEPTQFRPDLRAEQEEQILALVLLRERDGRDIPGWLPPEAFTTGPRRELFTAVTSLYERGEPIDALTADWERARTYGNIPSEKHELGPDTMYGEKLARDPVPAEVGIHASHLLFRSYVISQRATVRLTASPQPDTNESIAPCTAPTLSTIQPPVPRQLGGYGTQPKL
jgi:DnaB-like helicase N terminal domain